MNASDHNLMRRLAIGVLALFAVVAAYHRLYLLYAHKFFDVTGRAQWIWAQHQLSRNIPVAFFATRNFDLPPNRQFTRIKVAVDPEYTLYFNGAQIGGRRIGEDSALDVYDVSKLSRDRGNRIVIAARSANGVGGVIASIDITDAYKNVEPTGSAWNIVRAWRDDLLTRDPPRSWMAPPMLIGRPPIGRWNFLSQRPGTFASPLQKTSRKSATSTASRSSFLDQQRQRPTTSAGRAGAHGSRSTMTTALRAQSGYGSLTTERN
ncbi:MAG: hypothetical protein DMF59_04965 [Acidobacteria bacterium]|nr:MAG: hypothetical protein DMF59_04965 [Acidobacteriota bacterium]